MRKLLTDAGTLKSLELVERAEKGDDIDYSYNASFSGRAAKVSYGLALGDQVTHVSIR
ncbi:MAG: hypothetical protein ACO1O3_08995 [Sphingobium sp.]